MMKTMVIKVLVSKILMKYNMAFGADFEPDAGNSGFKWINYYSIEIGEAAQKIVRRPQEVTYSDRSALRDTFGQWYTAPNLITAH